MSTNRTGPAAARASRARLAALLLAVFVAGVAAGVAWQSEIRARLGLEGAARDGGASAGSAAEVAQLWTCGMHPQVIQDRPGTCPICGMALTPVAAGGAAAQGGERAVRYWWDPMMDPPYISDRPGKSPMGMDLVPVYADEVAAGAPLVIDPTVVQNMGLRVAPVERAPLARRIRAVGILQEPEPARHDVNLRVGGWVDRLHADTEGMRVAPGDPLFDLYSPELQVAVEELIGARRMLDAPGGAGERARPIHDAAVRKLELYGLAADQIAEIAQLERAPRALTIRSPAGGYLVEKRIYAGAAVAAGDTVMRIADASKLWLDVRVFEKDLALVRLDQQATATVDGRAEPCAGRVILVHPRIDPATRTALVRVEVDNAELALRHGMFATALLEVESEPSALVVPREAILDTGTRRVAFVALDAGHFEPREVSLGAQGDGGLVQVLAGLAPGERVVVSGQFLLDAESRMKEAVQRFLRQKALPAAGAEPGVAEPTTSAANELRDVSAAWKSAAESLVAAYLELARALGRPQESDEPVDAARLVQAARALREQASGGEQARLADALVGSASAMPQRPIAEQRKLFAAVSEAAIELAARSPRTGELVPLLFVAHCPMVDARWLQDSEAIANPYYATTMKACGEIERSLPIPRDAPAGREHGGDHR